MAIALRIARLHTRLQRPADTPAESGEARWLQELSQRSLATALGGVAERALARAGLPPEAVVAVRRLQLRLRLTEDTRDADFLVGWSQALEQALVQALGTRSEQATAQAVAFTDSWAAETAHLGQLLRWGEPAWWAQRLVDGRGAPLDLAPVAILRRWLECQPARAAATMAALAELPAPALGLGELLADGDARLLLGVLARRLSQRPSEDLALPAPGTALRALLDRALELLGRHPQLGQGASSTAVRLAPWRLAVLLRAQPTLSLLSSATLLALARGVEGAPGPSLPEVPATPPQPWQGNPAGEERGEGLPIDASSQPQTLAQSPPSARAMGARHSPSDAPARPSAWIHAGGLLLLLNGPALPAAANGDLALFALGRLLAPLGPGKRAAALQRERPLLVLLAPDRAWPERLDQAKPQDAAMAERHLAALMAAIPEAITFAPGALRQVYGPDHGATPPLPDQASHRLAALLWRPGLLTWDDWEIRLSWPLASVDGALRREGWDLDPGWQPALRRLVRFHYRAEPLVAGAERP